MSQELRDIAHWFLLYNSLELEKYLEEHKNMLSIRAGENILTSSKKNFPNGSKIVCKNKMANGKRNFIKPCSLATRKKTKYEMARDERMKENNERLKAAGIDRILADLRGSSLPNCTNEKRMGTRNGVDDPDYMPPSIEDANDDESFDSLEHELQ
ncbi:uncharacterized protein LOC131325703 [Rhododendron vialii]|uniref:uncharacterized protein LOC131325703 n=1 Tax=Rhododendron vialii TaxID=182163 RepID=UPI00265FC70B|nr:uncharacterized protein LOC131325703 [Rhododendron vialii]